MKQKSFAIHTPSVFHGGLVGNVKGKALPCITTHGPGCISCACHSRRSYSKEKEIVLCKAPSSHNVLPWHKSNKLVHLQASPTFKIMCQFCAVTSCHLSSKMWWNPVNHKIPKAPKKRGKTRNKMEGSTSKKTNEPPKRADHKRNIKFPNPFLLQERYQIRKREDLLIRGLTWMNPHQQQQHVSK